MSCDTPSSSSSSSSVVCTSANIANSSSITIRHYRHSRREQDQVWDLFSRGMLEMVPSSALHVFPRVLLPQYGRMPTAAAMVALFLAVHFAAGNLAAATVRWWWSLLLTAALVISACELLRRHSLSSLQEYIRRQRAELTQIETLYMASRRTCFWIAECYAGRIVGMVALREAAGGCPETGELLRMSVHSGFRQRGCATLLIRNLEAYAASVGYKRITLSTSSLVSRRRG